MMKSITFLGLAVLWLASAGGCTVVNSSDDADSGPAGEGGSATGGAAGAAGEAGEAGAAGSAGGAAGADSGVGGSGGTTEEEAIPPQAGGLEPAPDCVALEKLLKDDAKARNNALIDARINAIACYYDIDAGAGGSAGSAGSAGAAGAGGDPAISGSVDYSETNAQEDGVDEADIVKTDGANLYVLHGDRFMVVAATPPAQMAVASTVQLEGDPKEMFVEGGRAVIYSLVNGTSVYQAAGVTPKPATDPDNYYYSNPPAPDPNLYPPGYLLTKQTVIEIQGTPPVATVTGQFYSEGQYLSARRVDNSVRTVITGGAHGPQVKKELDDYPDDPQQVIAAYEQLRKDNNAKIDAATYKDWLPYRFVRNGTTVTASMPACNEYMVPKAGSSDYGLTQLQAFDWTTPTDIKSVNLPVLTTVVYGGLQSVYISASGYNYTYESYACKPAKAPVIGQVIHFDYTYIHEFDFKNSAIVPEYVGTGVFPGTILNQFSVDEYQEHFRVATYGELMRYVDGGGGKVDTEWEESSHVFTLEATDGKELKILGRVDGIGKGEEIYATRFIDDKAYVVTFRKVDPLTVVDLKDPAAPKIIAELTIPGFSEYVHPIGDPVTHLLTIGKETDSSSIVTGVALQLFDVTDPAAPKVQQKFVFEGETWGYSEAENNHKAFNYLPDKGVLMFPYVSDPYGSELHSFLEVFKIDKAGGASGSITRLGAVSHDDLFNDFWWEYCSEIVGAGVRRGVFISDNVYSISFGGIKVHALSDLTTLIKALPMSSPAGLGVQCAMP